MMQDAFRVPRPRKRTRFQIILLVLAVLILLNSVTRYGATQTSEDSTALSYRAFNQLADVYRLGGSAPDLVAKLNVALGQIQEVRTKRFQGDNASAARLEDQARSTIADIMKDVPVAQQRAGRDSMSRTVVIVSLVPVVVALSTFMFYGGLRGWRWYEKTRLFGMRIVEKKKIED